MGLYCFTNRRRAKDTILLIATQYGVDGITVFVKDGLVYVNVSRNDLPADIIMHYATLCPGDIGNIFDLNDTTEYYHDIGIEKFRV